MAVKTNYTKNGNNYFRVTATVGKDATGKPIRKEFYGKSKKEAEAKREEYVTSINGGLSVNYKNITLGNFMYMWLFEVLYVSDIKPSTFDRYEGLYRNYIKKSELNSMVVSEVRSMHVQRYYNNLYDSGKTPPTIKGINKVLRYFFNYALKEDMIVKNPCVGIVIPGKAHEKESKPIMPFTDEEIKRIEAAIGSHFKMIFLLALGTGLRAGELLALTIADIDLQTSKLTVNKNIKTIKDIKKDGSYTYKDIIQIPKTKSGIREVPIPSRLLLDLRKHITAQKEKHLANGLPFNNDSPLFTTDSCRYINGANMRKSFERTLKRADVQYRNFHNVRHTYATKLFEAGVELKTVSALLGHSNIGITANTYIHVMPKQKTNAAEKLNYLYNFDSF